MRLLKDANRFVEMEGSLMINVTMEILRMETGVLPCARFSFCSNAIICIRILHLFACIMDLILSK